MIRIERLEGDNLQIMASADEMFKFLTGIRSCSGLNIHHARDVVAACNSIGERGYMKAFVMVYEISLEAVRNIIARILPGDCDKSLVLKKLVQLVTQWDNPNTTELDR